MAFVTPDVDGARFESTNSPLIALVVVVVEEGYNLSFEITRQEAIFQQEVVFRGLVPWFDPAVGLRIIWRATRAIHAFFLQPFWQIP